MSDKFVRFTDSARDALALAEKEAKQFGHGYVGCEHLLLGLMRESMGMAGIILRTLGMDATSLETLIAPAIPILRQTGPLRKLDLSPGCKRALSRAVKEAQILGHPLVSTEHILIGLISQEAGVGSKYLLRLGISPAMVEAQIQQVLEGGRNAIQSPSKLKRAEFEDRFKIETVIGVGSMSTVYRARDMRFSDIVKFVAIKEMVVQVKDPTIRNNLIRNFREEANILASLRHPFIPRFFDFFSIENRFYIVMEYIVGQDLETILNDTDGLLPVRRALDWGIQLCDVLTYLHTRPLSPVIFRDLKPSNVMVDQHGNIRLIDFNIARVFEMGKKRANIGTQGYSPPEQYHGEVSPQSDIYALGATLHHLLTKKDPRLASPFTFHERKLSKIHPDVSEELETVINKAVAYRPEERYPRVEEMKYALMAVRKSFTSHG